LHLSTAAAGEINQEGKKYAFQPNASVRAKEGPVNKKAAKGLSGHLLGGKEKKNGEGEK